MPNQKLLPDTRHVRPNPNIRAAVHDLVLGALVGALLLIDIACVVPQPSLTRSAVKHGVQLLVHDGVVEPSAAVGENHRVAIESHPNRTLSIVLVRDFEHVVWSTPLVTSKRPEADEPETARGRAHANGVGEVPLHIVRNAGRVALISDLYADNDSMYGSFRQFDVETGREISSSIPMRVAGEEQSAVQVCVSPDEQYLALYSTGFDPKDREQNLTQVTVMRSDGTIVRRFDDRMHYELAKQPELFIANDGAVYVVRTTLEEPRTVDVTRYAVAGTTRATAEMSPVDDAELFRVSVMVREDSGLTMLAIANDGLRLAALQMMQLDPGATTITRAQVLALERGWLLTDGDVLGPSIAAFVRTDDSSARYVAAIDSRGLVGSWMTRRSPWLTRMSGSPIILPSSTSSYAGGLLHASVVVFAFGNDGTPRWQHGVRLGTYMDYSGSLMLTRSALRLGPDFVDVIYENDGTRYSRFTLPDGDIAVSEGIVTSGAGSLYR